MDLTEPYLIYLSFFILSSPSFTFLSAVVCPQDFIFIFVQFVFSFMAVSTGLHIACAIPSKSSPRREKKTKTKMLLRAVVVCVVSADCCCPRLPFCLAYLNVSVGNPWIGNHSCKS